MRDTLHRRLLDSNCLEEEPGAAVIEAFRQVDEEFLVQHGAEGDSSGSTAIILLVRGEELVIGNLGDCRFSLFFISLSLSRDHCCMDTTYVVRKVVTSTLGCFLRSDISSQGRLKPQWEARAAIGGSKANPHTRAGENQTGGMPLNP